MEIRVFEKDGVYMIQLYATEREKYESEEILEIMKKANKYVASQIDKLVQNGMTKRKYILH